MGHLKPHAELLGMYASTAVGHPRQRTIRLSATLKTICCTSRMVDYSIAAWGIIDLKLTEESTGIAFKRMITRSIDKSKRRYVILVPKAA